MSVETSGHHDPHLAHHFDTPHQQSESHKLGMWIFLATEVLMFGGLFCAYSVYRANHPEIFIYAHHYLNTTLGGINTLVLICSSLTMAWGVRAAQLNQKALLIVCLVLTLLGACGFLGIKYVEYKAKWEHGLLWGKHYKPSHELAHEAGIGAVDGPHGQLIPVEGHAASQPASAAATATASAAATGTATASEPVDAQREMTKSPGGLEGKIYTTTTTPTRASEHEERPTPPQSAPADPDAPRIKPAAMGPPGLAVAATRPALHNEPKNVRVFFSVYFLMTGLHGIHVLAGMGLIGWILLRAIRGEFSAAYFVPVDLVGLYWHLVDLIWIFLFPLLYLIH